ncbi:hypothetical protein V8E53_011498 [Lactarius tabidus]
MLMEGEEQPTIDQAWPALATTPMNSDSSPLSDRPTSVPSHARFTDRERLDRRIHIMHIWSDRLRLTSICASFFTSVDGFLLKLASAENDGSATSKLAVSSLAGALVFHAAAAILSYLGSLVLIRYNLRDTQGVTRSPGSNTLIAMTRAMFADSQPTDSSSSQTPSAVQSRHGQSSEKVECNAPLSNAPTRSHPYVIPRFSTRARSLFTASSSTATEVPILHHPSSLDINMERNLTFYRWNIVTDADGDSDGLMLLLNRCRIVCMRFVLAGFLLEVIGLVTFFWQAFEGHVSIFGSVCVGVCLVFGFWALLR